MSSHSIDAQKGNVLYSIEVPKNEKCKSINVFFCKFYNHTLVQYNEIVLMVMIFISCWNCVPISFQPNFD